MPCTGSISIAMSRKPAFRWRISTALLDGRVLGDRGREAELLRVGDHAVQQLGVQPAAAVVRVHGHVEELELVGDALAAENTPASAPSAARTSQ